MVGWNSHDEFWLRRFSIHPCLCLTNHARFIKKTFMAIKTKARLKKKSWKKGIIFLFVLLLVAIIVLIAGLKLQKLIFGPNVDTGSQPQVELFIPSNPNFEEVVELLNYTEAIIDIKSFIWLAQKKGYTSNPKPGRYILTSGMSNNDLVNMLRAGRQAPVNVTFNNIRTREELAGQLSKRLEPDSIQFLNAMVNSELLRSFGFESSTLLAMLIPNTYQMFWNTTAEGFLKRMNQEYEKFWNDNRRLKAEEIGLSRLEVSILASIVDEETIKEDEKPMVAGLYINRLDKGMRLQADPTIKFVLGDFTINRVLKRDLLIDSPYNTYIYAGLPPGPIRMPSISGIDAVLNHEKHSYLYMCAKDDFSGYHSFAKTLEQHNQNAARYHKALRRLRIYR